MFRCYDSLGLPHFLIFLITLAPRFGCPKLTKGTDVQFEEVKKSKIHFIILMFSRGMRQALAAYDAMLTSHPVRTKMATSITLAGFGDSCVQRMQLGKQDDSAAAVQREEGADGAGPAVADAAAAFGEVERSAHTWDAERTARQIFW